MSITKEDESMCWTDIPLDIQNLQTAWLMMPGCLRITGQQGSGLRHVFADPVDKFHNLPVNHGLVQGGYVCIFFADYNNISPDGDAVLVQPETFPDQPFYPVAFHCRTDFSGGGDTQTPVSEMVGPDKNNEIRRKITTAPGITFLKKGPFGYS